jgi:seryl-tRNA synthetase
MLNLRIIREEPDRVRQAVASRQISAPIDEIIALDAERRQLLAETEALRARRNAVSQQIARMKEKPAELIRQMREVGDEIRDGEQRLGEIETKLNDLVLYVPNLPDPSVPVGADADDNVEVRSWGERRAFGFSPRPHWEVGENLGGLDPARAAKISGSRAWVLQGDLSRLNRALVSWMMDLHSQKQGYQEVLTPFLVKRDCMVGTGQFPKFEEEAYTVDSGELVLIPTSEVSVVNLYREEILNADQLPIYHVSYSACFRKEAGAAGRDTRGLIRVHQFEKVEMVKLTTPETSDQEHEALVRNAEEQLQLLGLPYRVMLLCTGDLGFTAAKTYDLEAWFPGQDRFVEISSCSNCNDFQARRANIRYRPAAGERPEYVHTLNGSGLPLGRTLAAILENYQQPDGSVVVPEVLRGYLGGQDVLRPRTVTA